MDQEYYPAPPPSPEVAASPEDLRAANERLLLAGLREQERAAEARRLAEEMEHRALHDTLTGLPNRALFLDRLEQALAIAERERSTFALLFLDLDRFKHVNDRLGHLVGDQLLRQVAVRLRGALRQSDTLARLYGDEFAAILPGDDTIAAMVVAGKLLDALAPPFDLSGHAERVEASIGIATYPAHGSDTNRLLRQADSAMYAAKRTHSGHAVAEDTTEASQDPGDRESGRGDRAAARPTANGLSADAALAIELQGVNERLLLAGLREQELADQLRDQLAFSSAIVGNLGEGVCAVDRNCLLTFVNPAAEQLLGWAGAELIGREWDDVVHHRRIAGCPLLEALSIGVVYRADDDVFTHRDGSTFAVAYTATPIIAAGTVAGAVVIFGDITARRRAEVEHAALLARVEAALAFRTRFLSITTHELKTPLTVLKGTARLLARQARAEGDERLPRGLARIDNQVNRMVRLLDDLSDVAHIESDGLALVMQPVDLLALLRETADEVGAASPDFALRLEADRAPTGILWIQGDRARLQQVLINLLTNAVKYSPQRREAVIALRREVDRAIVSVVDYGIGIPAAQQANVFDPYVRGSNAAASTSGGLGLGLFISKAIVEQHGGTLTLDSEEGRGSTFSLSLPILKTDENTSG